MLGGPMRMMGQASMKPQNVGNTLGRFGHYFQPYWYMLIAVAVLVIVSTWTQVTTPDLTGQVVDCYLTPAAASTSAFVNIPGQQQATSNAQTNCWMASGAEQTDHDLTHQLIRAVVRATGIPVPAADNTPSAASRNRGL